MPNVAHCNEGSLTVPLANVGNGVDNEDALYCDFFPNIAAAK